MNCRTTSIAAFTVLLTFAIARGDARAAPREPQGRSWREVKCLRYKTAWSRALSRLGTRGLGREFLERHDAFLASGCTTKDDVCPRSAEELKLANIMVILAMNAGTASTFPPFHCGK